MPNAKCIQLRTPAQIRADFDRRGVTIAQFEREHGLRKGIAYQVLTGQKKGRCGEAHRAAVLLGLKAGVIEGQGDVK